MPITNKIAVAFLFVIKMEKEKAPGGIGTARRLNRFRKSNCDTSTLSLNNFREFMGKPGSNLSTIAAGMARSI